MDNVQYTEWLRKLSITQLHQEYSNMCWCSDFGIESKKIAFEKKHIVQLEINNRNENQNKKATS